MCEKELKKLLHDLVNKFADRTYEYECDGLSFDALVAFEEKYINDAVSKIMEIQCTK